MRSCCTEPSEIWLLKDCKSRMASVNSQSSVIKPLDIQRETKKAQHAPRRISSMFLYLRVLRRACALLFFDLRLYIDTRPAAAERLIKQHCVRQNQLMIGE